MREHSVPGGWYGAATLNGNFVALVPYSHVETSFGPKALPDREVRGGGAGPLYLDCTDVLGELHMGGQPHAIDTGTWFFRSNQWSLLPFPAYGEMPVLFDPWGQFLVALKPGDRYWRAGLEHSANLYVDGFRSYHYQTGAPVLGNLTRADPARQIHEFVDFGDVAIGQGFTGCIARFADGRRYVIQAGDTRAIRVKRMNDQLAIAMWMRQENRTAFHWLSLEEIQAHKPQEGLAPIDVPDFPRPLWCGAFFQYSQRYGSDPGYPSNCTVIVESGVVSAPVDVRGTPKPIIVNADPAVLEQAARVPEHVLALYIGDTGGWQNAARDAAEIKGRWAALGMSPRPVLWYVTPGDAAAADFRVPDTVDWVGPQFYFDSPVNLANQRTALFDWWRARLQHTAKPWVLIGQAYDRNLSPEWRAAESQLARLQLDLFDLLRDLPQAIGVLWFAVMRPGGVKNYPQVRAAHEAIFRAIIGPPAKEADVELKPPDVTVASYAPLARHGGRFTFTDSQNPDLRLAIEVWNDNGNVFASITHKGGTARTGKLRPIA